VVTLSCGQLPPRRILRCVSAGFEAVIEAPGLMADGDQGRLVGHPGTLSSSPPG
jgi:hypothetical protein